MTGTILGIEGGGTKTVAFLADAAGKIVSRQQFGALNLKLASDRQILAILRKFKPTAAALCLAGCRTPADRTRLHRLARRVWPTAKIFLGNDLDSGLAAGFGLTEPGILVISGTGSVVVGRNAAGTLRRLLRRLELRSPEQLVDWIAVATKAEVAEHADIFLRGNRGLLLQAASFLAMDALAVARQLQLQAPAVALAGGLLRNQPTLRQWVAHRIRQTLPGATVRLLRRDSAEGALQLAMNLHNHGR